jgi:hypothetical protein
MTGLTPAQLVDLVAGTLDDMGPPSFEMVAQELQDYIVMRNWLKKERTMIDSGKGIQRMLMDNYEQVAREVGYFEEDNIVLANHLQSITAPWVTLDTHWVFEYKETLDNRGKALIADVFKPRRAGAMLALAELLENRAWNTPTAAQDGTVLRGVPYYIVKNATAGFNGGLPSDHTTKAGVNITDHPKYMNYTDQYVAVTEADLVRKMRLATMLTGFKSPMPDAIQAPSAARRRLYVNRDTFLDFKEAASGRNDNLGSDFDNTGGEPKFNRNTIEWVPTLDSDTSDPVYGLDHNTFKVYVKKGDYLRETVKPSARGHNITETWTDLSIQFLCLNLRPNWVISK